MTLRPGPTRLVGLALAIPAAVGALGAAEPARADPPTAEMRRRVDEAFSDGRLEELDQLAEPGPEPVSLEPFGVRDLWWRPAPDGAPRRIPGLDVETTSVSARRLRWLAGQVASRAQGSAPPSEPYPMPTEGEDDPYPGITAWVRDRMLRETAGTTSLDADGPLADRPGEELLTYWVKVFRRPAIDGPGAEATDEEATAKRRAVHDGVEHARRLALLAVGFWGLVGGLLLWAARRRVKPPPPPSDA